MGGQVSGSQYYHGELSDVWFDDAYHADLSGFFDTATGKAKDLGANGELPTGTAPTAYWPLNAADPGRDASGNGNTLTVNSGPYPGGRGPNEYWAGSMQGNGTTQFLKRTSALNGAAASGIFSVVWAIVRNTSAGGRIFHLNDSSTGGEFYIEFGSTGTLAVIGKNSADTTIFNLNKATLSSSGVWEIYHLCIDLSSTSLRHLYKDSAAVGTITWNNYADDAIDFSVDIAAVGGAALSASASDWWPGKIGFFAFYPGQYIDFSQEANRLLTVDAFGYPVYLGERGELPTGIPPALYLNRNFHLGTDSSGNGNNFTPQNGPVDGGSVRGDE
ncbi:hypothetical protein SAMN05660686_02485 [Thalassobaculum litoreum DSM 18839]|uniref:Concanavalin A-like lectin/glucanases superfamily protein n=1 Tax=Thalassobaculum litoreum DSM 18839 TaxID=1123362 RepID=A0A8G2BI29_9PROT|nr:hypothetical protein SAMN05660686_02485 [Thalassobaculum litoreum DSM 18839]